MTASQPLFDRTAQQAKRRRVLNTDDLFLHALVQSEIKERLRDVNRSFTKPAIVTGFPDFWANTLTGARIVGDDDTLPLEPGRHDLVIHAMGLHGANDPVGQLVQCRRALCPDGLLIAAFPGGRTLHELRSALAEAEVRLTDGLSPRVLPMAEIRDLGGLLQRAGLALPVADSILEEVSYASPLHLMHDLRSMGETNILTGRKKTFTPRCLMELAAQIYIQNYSGDQGRVPATFEMMFLTGWAPDPSQPTPLRPGSAVTRLADALGTTEHDPENMNDTGNATK